MEIFLYKPIQDVLCYEINQKYFVNTNGILCKLWDFSYSSCQGMIENESGVSVEYNDLSVFINSMLFGCEPFYQGICIEDSLREDLILLEKETHYKKFHDYIFIQKYYENQFIINTTLDFRHIELDMNEIQEFRKYLSASSYPLKIDRKIHLFIFKNKLKLFFCNMYQFFFNNP